MYAPEAALGGFPGGRASHGEAGKGRKAPYGVLQRERCLHAVCSKHWEGQGNKNTFPPTSPTSLQTFSWSLGRPWLLYSSPRESLVVINGSSSVLVEF